jgi:hypothetical protein
MKWGTELAAKHYTERREKAINNHCGFRQSHAASHLKRLGTAFDQGFNDRRTGKLPKQNWSNLQRPQRGCYYAGWDLGGEGT